MWENIVLWRVAVAILILVGILISIFYLVKLNKIKEGYNKSIDEAERDVRDLKEKEDKLNNKYGKIITTLIDLLHTYEAWINTKDSTNKLAFDTIFNELPPEIRKLIKTKA